MRKNLIKKKRALLELLHSPETRGCLHKTLAVAGVPLREFCQWQAEDERFAEELRRHKNALVSALSAPALLAFEKRLTNGDLKALELYFELVAEDQADASEGSLEVVWGDGSP